MNINDPTTISTRCYNIKKGITAAFEKSSDLPLSFLDYVVNDFGLRGATCHEAGGRGGAAHLLHFQGSDNMTASRTIKDYYGHKGRAKSVWATEHSVATSFGPGRGEFDYIIHQLKNATKGKIVSIVIDTYDSENFLRNVVGSDEIKALIIEFTASGGRVVFRPDSGNPLVNVCHYSDLLGGIFGFSINSKGYKVLNHNVGLIQGDGMTEESIIHLYNEYIKTGWSAENVVVGSGGGLLQVDANRDTQRFAIKASYGERLIGLDTVPFNLQKMPKTDLTKASKAGQLILHNMGRGAYMTIESSKDKNFASYTNSLATVYENGTFNKQHFKDLLLRAA